jgi:hypothetical protein
MIGIGQISGKMPRSSPVSGVLSTYASWPPSGEKESGATRFEPGRICLGSPEPSVRTQRRLKLSVDSNARCLPSGDQAG